METFIVTYKLVKIPTDKPVVKITDSKDVFEFIKPYFGTNIDVLEELYIILLNNRNHIIGVQLVSRGGTTGTVADLLLIMKYIVDSLATRIILVHNHPSGDLISSREDDAMTKSINNATDLFNIELLDHLIISKDEYKSYADNNLL